MFLQLLSNLRICKPKKKSVTVIGIGSLGSSIVKTLSDINIIDEIVAIDFDIVEEKNLKNSCYKKEHIGKYKTDVISELISNPKITMKTFKHRYEEGITKLLPTDLVFDCRDIICTRNNQIHTKFYISGRSLIIDCKRNITYENQIAGKYNDFLSKTDISKCALVIAQILQDGSLEDLIQKQLIYKYDIDEPQLSIQKYIRDKNDSLDILYDSNSNVIDLYDHANQILRSNLEKPVQIVIGYEHNPILKRNFASRKILTIDDLSSAVNSVIRDQNEYQYFSIQIKEVYNLVRVFLIPETGGA